MEVVKMTGNDKRMKMLAFSAMALGHMMAPVEVSGPISNRGPGRSISKKERAKRNVRKNIAKQSKKRNRSR